MEESTLPAATKQTLEDGREVTTRVFIPGKVATVDGVFTKEECEQIIKQGKMMGFTSNDDENALDQRMRFEFYDEKFGAKLFSAVRHALRDQLKDGRTPTRVRDKVRLYKYDVNDSFRPHVDGGYTFRTGPYLGESAVYTFVLYLNGPESGLDGGATRFCDVPNWPAGVSKAVEPEIGKVLIFQQKHMKHEGGAVKAGTKFIIQGMIMYSRPVGTTALPAPNIFEQVLCVDDDEHLSSLSDLNEKVIWRPSFGEQDRPAHERLVLMAKSGLPQEAIIATLKRQGLSQTQIEEYLPQIIKEAQERLRAEPALEASDKDPGATTEKRKGSLRDTSYYAMLKAGHSPQVVKQKMVVVGQMDPAVAERTLQAILRQLQEDGITPTEYDY